MVSDRNNLGFDREIEMARRMADEMCARWPGEIALAVKNSAAPGEDVYHGYPYLFADAFVELPAAEVRTLAIAMRLFVSAIFSCDSLMDDDLSPPDRTTRTLHTIALQADAYQLFNRLFPAMSDFWPRLNGYLAEFVSATATQHSFRTGIRPWAEFDETQARLISQGQSGIARTAIAGLAQLAADDAALDPLSRSILQFYFGLQMFDDLRDWREDRRSGIPSLLLVQAGGDSVEPDMEIARRIYYDGHADYVLDLAGQALDTSLELCPSDACLGWRTRVIQLKRAVSTLRRDAAAIVQRNISRARSQPRIQLRLATTGEVLHEPAADALRFIAKQWQLGYGEARHRTLVTIARREPASADVQQYETGDLFQRAIIADALCDALRMDPTTIQTILDYEVGYFIEQRRTIEPGGWSYWLASADDQLPSDTDSLAQVMQVMLRAGNAPAIRENCEAPLSALLRQSLAGGGFVAWIMPPAPSPFTRRLAGVWGTRDVAVTANVLHALAQLDAHRFVDHLNRGATYLQRQQGSSGAWQSRRYQDPYYATYVALRVLARIAPATQCIDGAVSFIRASQLVQGGWGPDECNPLSTALSLLAMAEVAVARPELANDFDASSALKALVSLRRDDGAWPAAPFIRRPSTHGVICKFESATVTTAFVLKAMSAWSTMLDGPPSREGCRGLSTVHGPRAER